MKVPCRINEGKKCGEPYCRMFFFYEEAERARKDWFKKIEKKK